MLIETWIALITLAFLAGICAGGYIVWVICEQQARDLRAKLRAEQRQRTNLEALATLTGQMLNDIFDSGGTIAPGSVKAPPSQGVSTLRSVR